MPLKWGVLWSLWALCLAVDESHLLTQRNAPVLIQQKSSVERGKLGSESMAVQLQQALALVQGLATNVTEWDTNLSDTESTALGEIKSFIETLLVSAHTSHAEDQNEVDRAEDLIGGCATTAQGKLDGEVADLHTDMESSRTSHSDCRLLEANYTGGQGTQCAEWDLFRKDPSNVPGDCASLTFDSATLASEGTLQASMEKCLRDLRPHYEEHIQCKYYTDLLNSKAPVCDTKQTEFEDDFCRYSEKLVDICAEQQQCRATLTSFRNETHEDVLKSEVARKADFETGKHILCYFQVFEAVNEHKSTTLQECNALVVDSSNLTINYPSIPAPTDCIVAPAEPCDTAWTKTEYDDQTWFSNVTMVDCTACPGPPVSPVDQRLQRWSRLEIQNIRFQDSAWMGANQPENCVDQDIRTMCHSATSAKNSIEASLKSTSRVSAVRIVNNAYMKRRLVPFQIQLFASDQLVSTVRLTEAKQIYIWESDYKGYNITMVKIQQERADYLHLVEVELYGVPNVAWSASFHPRPDHEQEHVPAKCVDRDLQTMCHSKFNDQYMEVWLKPVSRVYLVRLVNRAVLQDRLVPFQLQLFTSGAPTWTVISAARFTDARQIYEWESDYNGSDVHMVKLYKTNPTPLHLMEFEVYGVR